MFSGSIIVITTLVVFSPQGQAATASSPAPSLPASTSSDPGATSSAQAEASTSSGATATATAKASASASAPASTGPPASASSLAPASTPSAPTPTPSATTGGSSPSVAPTASSLEKTCGSINVTLKTPNGGMNKTRDDFRKAIESFFNDSQKYKDVEVSDLDFGTPEEGTFELTLKLCMAYIPTDGFIEDVFLQQVKDGKLLNIAIADGENSFTFEASDVKFSDWKANDGECKKCSEGGGGPIETKGECKPEPGYSCKGLKNTKKVNDCLTYCDTDDESNAVSNMISTLVMAMGIALSLSYNIWE